VSFVPDFSEYLRFCCSANLRQNQQDFYTPISAELPLQAQSIVSSQSSPRSASTQEEKKRMDVLAGLRQYAPEHILLVGKPGSGKSTALKQLLWENTQQYLETEIQAKRKNLAIPVLIELRDCREGLVVDWLHRALRRANLTKDVIETLLSRRHFLLLFDGLNELPSSEVRAELGRFRRDYADVPMIFTTRELGAGEDLGIEKKLEMVPLSEAQMRRFIEVRLPGRTDVLLKQLQGRLQELAETPMLLWMLCEVFAEEQQIPRNRGELFRRHFTQKYDQFKQARSLPISEDSRRLTAILLQQLAFEMMQGNTPTEFRLQISISEARQILEAFLRVHGEVSPASRAGEYLEDLLEFHILQLASDPNKIEFHHQLFQEYYAAEYLLLQLSQLNDEQLKCHYLNYLKWTESIALALALVEDSALAVRLVKLALDIDWGLGARLAGEVKPAFQQQTVSLLDTLKIPGNLKIGSFAIPYSDKIFRLSKVVSSGKGRREVLLYSLLKALKHPNPLIRQPATRTAKQIFGEEALANFLELDIDPVPSDGIPRLLQVRLWGETRSEAVLFNVLGALKHPSGDVWRTASWALCQIESEVVEAELLKALEDSNPEVRQRVVQVLNGIGSKASVIGMLKALEDSESSVRRSAASVLKYTIKYNIQESGLVVLIKSIKHSNSDVREKVIEALGEIGSESAAAELLETLEDSESNVRENAVEALGKIGSEVAATGLLKILADSNSNLRWKAAIALGKIGGDAAITGLLKALTDKDPSLRRSAVEALGEIGNEAAIAGLFKAIEDSDIDVRKTVAHELGKIGSEAAALKLLELLQDPSNFTIFALEREIAVLIGGTIEKVMEAAQAVLFKAMLSHDPNYFLLEEATEALRTINSDLVSSELLRMLQDSDAEVRWRAAWVLGKIYCRSATAELLKASKDTDLGVRLRAGSALLNIDDEVLIIELISVENHPDFDVSSGATKMLHGLRNSTEILRLFKIKEHPDSNISRRASSILLIIDLSLSSCGEESMAAKLCKLLEHENASTRQDAARILQSEFGDEIAIAGLLKAIENENFSTREDAVAALSKIGSDLVVTELLKALEHQNSDVRGIAAIGLGKIGNEAAIAGLLKAMEDSSPDVRGKASSALRQIEGDKVAVHLSHLHTLILKDTRLLYSTIKGIQQQCQFYNYEIYWKREKVENAVWKVQDEEVRQLIYHIESVPILNTGNVTIYGNQTET